MWICTRCFLLCVFIFSNSRRQKAHEKNVDMLKGVENVWSFLHWQVGPEVATTWGRWWTAESVPRNTLAPFSPTPSHSHFVPVWLITSAALSLLLFFPNIMWDEVKCYGKLSKIKTREQLSSQISRMTFIAQLLTQPCLCCPWRWVLMTDCSPWKEWECCIQRRWRCAMHYHSPSLACFVLCSFLHFVHSSSSPFPYSCFVFVTSHPPVSLCFCRSSSTSSPGRGTGLLSFAQILKSFLFPLLFPIQLLSVLPHS